MSRNAANSQRPSRGDSSLKPTVHADADRRNPSSSSAATPSRNMASPPPPPPAQYAEYSSGYPNAAHPPAINAHSHYQHHQPHHLPGPPYSSYGNAPTSESFGYSGPSYHPVRHVNDTHQYPRSRPSYSQSQSSGSGSSGTTHDAAAGSHYAPHYAPSYPAAPSNAPLAHTGRTRWAWVPIEVSQTHPADDAHLQQYAPYPATYYPSQAASAPASHAASSSHPSYQYGEAPVQGAPSYAVQSTPSSYAPSYPHYLHPSHYGPPHGHTSHSHGAPPGRGHWSGSQQGGARDHNSGPGSRRSSNQPSRSGSSQRRTSSNSSGNHSSPLPGTTPLPLRSDASRGVREVRTPSSQPSEPIEEDVHSESALATEGDVDFDMDLSIDAKGVERVPGSGLRPHYHPQQGPRSEWVLWCGNVPQDATVEELWEVFSRLSLDEFRRWLARPEGQEFADDSTAIDEDVEDHGVLSIFIISRSNCAFVNYATSTHLDRAVRYFQGKQVRPRDSRCPKLVCRVRKKDDEAQAGVAGQRGRGIHVAWLKQQRELERAQNTSAVDSTPSDPITQLSSDPPSSPSKDASVAAAGLTSAASYSSSGSTSYASTNSSLFRHPAFRHRFFILKSLRADDLDRSIETGYWATQPHNENVLDQAYRNSETVFLIFGVNQTGQFHGYAKMAGPIHTSTNDGKDKNECARGASQSSVLSGVSGSMASAAASIPESVDENAVETEEAQSLIVASPVDDEPRPHPVLDKRDIEAARSLFGAISVDGGVQDAFGQPMMSPLPITPTREVGPFEKSLSVSPQRNDTITPQNAEAYAQSSTWPYTALKSSSGGSNNTETDSAARPKLTTALSDIPAASRTNVAADEHGVRRIDMETESALTASTLNDQPSLAPSDSASWSSADPRVAEQIALRAVIHNLRLDEMESRGQAERLENKLRSTPGNTPGDTENTAASTQGDEPPASQGDEPRSPPRQSSSDSWGKPFRVEWIRTDPLPFQRVKKLRNPWRDNRQVKVSRDGTELEPGVGRQLLEEWNRLHSAAPVDSTKASSKPSEPRSSSAARLASDEDE